MRRSSSTRFAGLGSAARWWRAFTTPRAWKVCTSGMGRPAVPLRAARPDIQKCAWAMSGGSCCHSRASRPPNSGMCGSSSSFSSGAIGPAGKRRRLTPGLSFAVRRASGSVSRVYTVTE